MGKTIIISNRLPVKISKNEDGFKLKPSEGGLATGLGSIYKQGGNLWVGWPGLEIENSEQQTEVSKKLLRENLVPVFLSQEEINFYYEGFSNEILWPVFHYFPSYAKYHQTYWDWYKQVNRKFSEVVLPLLEAGDTVWVHDYQLLLLPDLIRKAIPGITIGFFQHIPFPSFELFRLIPWRKELLEGVLGADLVGFHTYEDAHYFLNSAKRLLPVQTSSNIVTTDHRTVVVDSFPMGIDFKKYEAMTGQAEVKTQVQTIKETFQNVTFILSIDRLDYSKGILERLQALELLLTLKPQYIEKVVLYMIVVPSRDTVPQYKELQDEIDKVVGSMNARFRTLNWIPVHYYYRSFPFEMLSALYYSADICLVTPMRDGMNLVCKEYVASKVNNDGVLILSEMAGASKELVDAIIVNPNNVGEIYRAITEALEMSAEEKTRRMKAMREIVSKFNINHWVKLYMSGLKEVKQLQSSMETKRINTAIKEDIEKQYIHADKRIIFLDYDGTLVGFKGNINQAAPDVELYDILRQLTADTDNKIVLISGRNYQTLEEWFKGFAVDMIAEHGAWQKKYTGEWSKLPGLTDSWKQDIFPILETYTDRTPGSFIEEKSFSLVWHYRKVEGGLGELRANELLNNLSYYTSDKGLQLLPGNKVVEIKNMEVNKGMAALSWLENTAFDFIMALGDDHTDEDIFKALPEQAISVKVGTNKSAAKYYLSDFQDVRQLLKSLSSKNTIPY
ncbi:bifunctional alpha,alpha-trehalose-phosphate synthase (UDP-forming)/trehalose-phosphatase [Rubrolithibacter danxiaensis]|uniref:bifunctional alpha,alpha-trehalose-phosphate synthase (UDP-forming)/trehalose-phosphatase n=1 Tax=Rubrolithibacter danxiaensis TaxID=3390805 RepID=UPI003BF91815